MDKCVTVAIAGLGNRGRETYAVVSKKIPDKMKIVAIADTDPVKRDMTAEEYGISEEHCYASAEEMLKADRLADVMFICTQDRQHVSHAVSAIEKGYHLLLEKPISPDIEACKMLLDVAKKHDRKVVVCHVLRYTPIFRKVKELLDSNSIGEIVSITALENVGWYHYAHSFVRGNWANSEKSSPMILQKCCHDMDLYLWLAGKKCRSVSSFGSTYLFKEEMAPDGIASGCMDGCKAKSECCFDAEEIYINNKKAGFNFQKTGYHGQKAWPLNVLAPEGISRESITKAIKEGPYGRCVYKCDNNVVDHQVVNLLMTDNTTMSFTMCGFSADISRYAKFMGTKGELTVNMAEDVKDCEITVRKFNSEFEKIRIDVASLSDDFSGHGGGDVRMVEEFIDFISGRSTNNPFITSLEKSLESHFCALAAEESRLQDGKTVYIHN